MNQKLSNWASAAEILSGVAVIVTLLILIVGVRENTEITRTAMYGSITDQFNAFETEMLLNPDLRPIYFRYLNSEPGGFQPNDQESVAMMVAILFRTLDRAFAAKEKGQIGDEEWARLERSVCTNYKRAESFDQLPTVRFLTTDSFWEFAVESCDDFTSPFSPRQ